MNHTMKIENEDEAIVFSAHIGDIGHLDLALLLLTAIKGAQDLKPKRRKRSPNKPKTVAATA